MIGEKGKIQLPSFSPPSHLNTYIQLYTPKSHLHSKLHSYPLNVFSLHSFLKTTWVLALPLLSLSTCPTGAQALLVVFRGQEPSPQDMSQKGSLHIHTGGCHLPCRRQGGRERRGKYTAVYLSVISQQTSRQTSVVCVCTAFSCWGIRCLEDLRHTSFSRSWSWSLYIPFSFSDVTIPPDGGQRSSAKQFLSACQKGK